MIHIGHLGDSVLATTILDPLRTVFGGGLSVDFAAGPGAGAAILQLNQRVNRVFPIAHRRLHWRFAAGKRQLQSEASNRPYDLVVNLECGSECDDFARFVQHREFCGRPFASPKHSRTRHCVDTEKSIQEGRLGRSATRSARCVVSVDTGTMHLAAALGTPVVALFGPTIPALTGLYSKTTPVRVLTSGIGCQPCDRTTALKRCSFNRCMAELQPAAVFEALRKIARSWQSRNLATIIWAVNTEILRELRDRSRNFGDP